MFTFPPAYCFRLLTVFCLVLLSPGLVANTKQQLHIIDGELIQGGLIVGRVAPTDSIRILDRDVHVQADGRFVFGLGRDADRQLVIQQTSSTGDVTAHTFDVKQREYRVQKIEGVASNYVSPPESVLARIRDDNRQVAKARQTFRTSAEFLDGFIRPAKGPITGVYGSQRVFNGVPKRPHYGLDIAGPVGTPIVAPASGVVTLAHENMYYSGGTLIVDHGQGVSSTFIHLSKLLVKVGDVVEQGDTIAEMGDTGRVTGPHLDWRVNWFSERLDPALLLSGDDSGA